MKRNSIFIFWGGHQDRGFSGWAWMAQGDGEEFERVNGKYGQLCRCELRVHLSIYLSIYLLCYLRRYACYICSGYYSYCCIYLPPPRLTSYCLSNWFLGGCSTLRGLKYLASSFDRLSTRATYWMTQRRRQKNRIGDHGLPNRVPVLGRAE